jgi:exopolysaccharide biosynthesis polyprenyl glycosylphosphotransferase
MYTPSAGVLALKAEPVPTPAYDHRPRVVTELPIEEPKVREPDPLPGKQAGRLAAGFTSKINLVVDLLALVGSIYLSTYVSGRPIHTPRHDLFWFSLASAMIWVIGTAALRHYDLYAYQRDRSDDAAMVSVMVVAILSFLVGVKLVHYPGHLPRDLRFLAIFLPIVLGVRLYVFRALSRYEEPAEEVLIVGSGPMARATGRDLLKSGRRHLIGYLVYPDEAQSLVLRNPVLGTAFDLESILRTLPVSEVYIAGNALRNGAHMQRAVSVCESLGVPFALPAYTLRLERAVLHAEHGTSDGYLHFRVTGGKRHQLGLKRLFDIVSSAAALWLLTPALALVAIAVKLTSRGPIFYKQVRAGLHGREFNMLKFRTMVVGADAQRAELLARNEQTGPVFKMRNDPRVTRIGRFLRRYSIDELPQLLNVLRGDMSVVGPRPPLPSEVMKYAPWHRRRLSVRPGLTCIWQVSGRSQISFEQWMYMDMQYIDHWNLLRDFDLIFRTVPAVMTGRGAS